MCPDWCGALMNMMKQCNHTRKASNRYARGRHAYITRQEGEFGQVVVPTLTATQLVCERTGSIKGLNVVLVGAQCQVLDKQKYKRDCVCIFSVRSQRELDDAHQLCNRSISCVERAEGVLIALLQAEALRQNLRRENESVPSLLLRRKDAAGCWCGNTMRMYNE